MAGGRAAIGQAQCGAMGLAQAGAMQAPAMQPGAMGFPPMMPNNYMHMAGLGLA